MAQLTPEEARERASALIQELRDIVKVADLQIFMVATYGPTHPTCLLMSTTAPELWSMLDSVVNDKDTAAAPLLSMWANFIAYEPSDDETNTPPQS